MWDGQGRVKSYVHVLRQTEGSLQLWCTILNRITCVSYLPLLTHPPIDRKQQAFVIISFKLGSKVCVHLLS